MCRLFKYIGFSLYMTIMLVISTSHVWATASQAMLFTSYNNYDYSLDYLVLSSEAYKQKINASSAKDCAFGQESQEECKCKIKVDYFIPSRSEKSAIEQMPPTEQAKARSWVNEAYSLSILCPKYYTCSEVNLGYYQYSLIQTSSLLKRIPKCLAPNLSLCNDKEATQNCLCGVFSGEQPIVCETGQYCMPPDYITYHTYSCVVSKDNFKNIEVVQSQGQELLPTCLTGDVTEDCLCKSVGITSTISNICYSGMRCTYGGLCITPTPVEGKLTCSHEDLKKKYGADRAGDCYSCLVVNTLVETFLKAAAKVYHTSQEAGIRILALGFVIWMALFMLKNLSQVTSLEPANMIDQLLKMGFKMIVAYLAIVIGARALGSYLVEPIVMFSSNFASQLLANSEKDGVGEIFEQYGSQIADMKNDLETLKQQALSQEGTPKPEDNKPEVATEQTEEKKAKEDCNKTTFSKEELKQMTPGTAALALADEAKKNSGKLTGNCLGGVRKAMGRAGIGNLEKDLMVGEAKKALGVLQKNYDFNIINIAAKDLTSLPNGSVVVYGPRCKNGTNYKCGKPKNHGGDKSYDLCACGHIEVIVDGKGYSDGKKEYVSQGNYKWFYAFITADTKVPGCSNYNNHEVDSIYNTPECRNYVDELNAQTDSMYNNNSTPGQQRADDIASDIQSSKSSAKRYWIGDSRTVGICNVITKNSGNECNKESGNDIFKSKISQTFEYLKELKGVTIAEGATIIVNLGVNNPGANTTEKLETYLAPYKDKYKIVLISAGHVNTANTNAKNLKNADIDEVNKRLKQYASDNANVEFLDITTQSDIDVCRDNSENKNCTDGIHYNAKTYKKIYDFIVGKLGGSGSGTTSSSSSDDSGTISANAPIVTPEKDANGKPIPVEVRNAITKASNQYKVNPALIAAVIQTESGYVRCVVSRADCHGYMQVLRENFSSYGHKKQSNITQKITAISSKDACTKNAHRDDPIYDTENNIMAGTHILKANLDTYKGDVHKALMAYNWGAGNVNKYLSGAKELPIETQNHLKKTKEYYSTITGGRALAGSVTNSGYSSGPCGGSKGFYIPNTPLGKIEYKGDETILSASVIQSMLNAQMAINNRLVDLQILGNALTCFAADGGAWAVPLEFWGDGYITDIFTWIVGAVIWCAGFMLIMAVAYYLLDISFKLGFMVIALPVVIGLWPFNMTKGKLSVCLSVIMKAAATYAFLAITVNYGVYIVENMIQQVNVPDLINTMQMANENRHSSYEVKKVKADTTDDMTKEQKEAAQNAADAQAEYEAKVTVQKTNVQYVKEKISLFSLTFILILFALIYAYKLIGSTVKDLVNKFFPDQMFGNEDPMHKKAMAATKYAKDIAMKPGGLARDIAVHQAGRAGGALGKKALNAVAHPVKTAKGVAGGVSKAAKGTQNGVSKAANWVSNKLGKEK